MTGAQAHAVAAIKSLFGKMAEGIRLEEDGQDVLMRTIGRDARVRIDPQGRVREV